MKYAALLPQVALVFAVAYACTDSTAPANSRSLLVPKVPVTAAEEPPPPPVGVSIAVCVSGICSGFEGSYFSNGSSLDAQIAARDLGDLDLAFSGTAWLRFNNTQPIPSTAVSANARIKNSSGNVSGNGTLSYAFGAVVIVIDDVMTFEPNPECSSIGEPCAFITFTATVNGIPDQFGQMAVYNSEYCIVDPDDEGDTGCPPPFVDVIE